MVVAGVLTVVVAAFMAVALIWGGVGNPFDGNGAAANPIATTTECNNPQAVSDFLMAQGFKAGVALTFAPDHQPDDEEMDAQWELVSRLEGNALLPRSIR